MTVVELASKLHMKTLSEAGVRFPILVLHSDWVSFYSDEAMFSRGAVRGRARIGERLTAQEGLRFVDQGGNVFVVSRATVIEDMGLLFDNSVFRLFAWFGGASTVVSTKLHVEYCETVEVEQLRRSVLPALENSVRVQGEEREGDLSRAKSARTIPELIAAAE